MRTEHFLCGWMAMVAIFISASVGAAENLIADPGFKKANFEPLAEDTTWLWYQIEAPSEAEIVEDASAVKMTGGKTFLHSSRFKVEPGKNYQTQLTAEGKGKASVEFLWWTEDGGMADPHRTIPIEPVEIKEGKQKLEGADTAPEKAAEAYIRVVVEAGTVTVSEPTVTAAN